MNRSIDLGPDPSISARPGGPQLVFARDFRQPLVAVSLVIGAGSAQDPPGKAGLAHLVAQLASLAKHDRPATDRDYLARLGAVVNDAAAFDSTTFLAFTPPPMWREALGIALARLTDPLAGVDEAAFRREVDVARNRLWQSSPVEGVGSGIGYLQQAIFDPGDSYAHPLFGTPESLATLTLEDARAFARRYYRTDKATVYLDGALPHGSEAFITASLPAVARPATAENKEMEDSTLQAKTREPPKGMVSYDARIGGAEVWVGWPIPGMFSQDGVQVSFFAQLAANQLGSRWFEQDAPGVIGARVRFWGGVRGGLLFCRARLREGADPTRAANAIIENVAHLWAAQISLNASRRQRSNLFQAFVLRSQESIVQRARYWPVFAHFTRQPKFFIQALADTLQTMDVLDIGEAIHRIFRADQARVVFLKPTQRPATTLPDTAPVFSPTASPRGPSPVPFPTSEKDLETVLGTRPMAITTETLANGMQTVVSSRRGDPVATLLLGFHGGTATAYPAGAAEGGNASALFAVSDNQCSSLDRCGVEWLPPIWGADATANLYRALPSMVPHTLENLSQEQAADWVEWPNGSRAVRYLASRRRENALAEAQADRQLDQLLFPDPRWGRTVPADELLQIDSDAIKVWINRQRAARNSVLLVAGDVDRNSTMASIRQEFGSWTVGLPAPPSPPIPPIIERDQPALSLVEWPGSAQAYVLLGCRLPDASAEMRGWRGLFAQALAHSLDRSFRGQLGNSPGIDLGLQELRDGASSVRLSTMVSAASLPGVMKEIIALTNRLGQGEWPLDLSVDLDGERWEWITREAMRLATSDGLARELFHEWSMGWPLDGGVSAQSSLTKLNPEKNALVARTCKGSAVVVVAADGRTLNAIGSVAALYQYLR